MTDDLLSDAFAVPRLASQETHLWLVSLQKPSESIPRFASCLNQQERASGARFHSEDNQRRYLISHATVRLLLARYLHCPPASLEFSAGQFGKPFICSPRQESKLHFNLAHSADIAAVAISTTGPVGVDIERLRGTTDISRLVTRYFSNREIERFQRVDTQNYVQWFFRMWTCKEAVSKALGCGLSEPVSRFTVPDGGLRDTVQVRAASKLENTDCWYVTSFRHDENYVGAVATPGTVTPQITIRTIL
jgi:4'-phosphopantetheinyl transferase